MNSKLATLLFFVATPALTLPAVAQDVANVQPSHAALMRSGLNNAVQQGVFPMQPADLYNAVLSTITDVESGKSIEAAAKEHQVRASVLRRLMEMATPETQPAVNVSFPTVSAVKPALSLRPQQPVRVAEPKVNEKEVKQLAKALKQIEKLQKEQQQLWSEVKDLKSRQKQIKKQGDYFIARLNSIEKREEQQDIFLAVKPQPKAEPPEESPESDPQIIRAPSLQVATRPTSRPVAIYPKAQASSNIDELTPVQIAHAIRRGLNLRGRKEVPYGSRDYRKVQGAMRLLNRGNSLENAARRVRLSSSVLKTLAGYGGVQ